MITPFMEKPCVVFLLFSGLWHVASCLRMSAGQPLDALGAMLGKTKVAVVPDMTDIEKTSSIIKGIAQEPAPMSVFTKSLIDPLPKLGSASCDRDYSVPCPEHFVNIGLVMGGQNDSCAASTQYVGPCASEAYYFASMSTQSKARWSDLCGAFWPCLSCERQYQAVCPQQWTRVDNSLKCAPSAEYHGPCRGMWDFQSFTEEMYQQWSAECGAFWGCAD